ncbi:MAG TPA: hypothetical protein P5531_11510 [Bacteroidales bacterium]|nr:hypothetical protein [Bacteroidales bacterium]HSA44191.1 hypothetical protein [Bacteroidales bacterium]
MPVKILKVQTKAELRKFIRLPAAINRHRPNWLPPLWLDEWQFFDNQKNTSFRHCDTLMLLALRNAKPRGRIMGIIHRKYNELHDEKTARFAFLECYNEPEVSHALITAVENWAIEHGMEKIIGPYGFSDKDPQGLLISGFEHPPVIASPCNPEYMPALVEREGYGKEVDCNMFLFSLETPLPEVYRRIAQRCAANPEYRLLELTGKRDLKSFIVPILEMVNETYKDIYGFVPLQNDEMQALASRYMPVINPRFVKIILHHGQVVAFILGIPNMTKGIQRSRGRLFPLGLFHIWWAGRVSRKLDLMLGGVLPQHQGKGLEVYMSMKLISSALEADYNMFEVHLVLETNRPMQAEMERAGARAHKSFRVYAKSLHPRP